ncbi:hypothetical protein [Desulfocicer niacini]
MKQKIKGIFWGVLIVSSILFNIGCNGDSNESDDSNDQADVTFEVTIGDYGQIYDGDWSELGNGKELADMEISEDLFESVTGDTYKQTYSDETYVEISDESVQVTWSNSYGKYDNALYYVKNCDKVVFENINVIQKDSDYRASSTILVEDCEEVVIRNVFIAGTANKPHIRIDGCERVLIEYVEISGYDYGDGWMCATGINIGNSPLYVNTDNPRELQWTIIQNCYIHDNTATDEERNQDGILMNAASNGIIFNCYFENWGIENEVADAAIDVSHRNDDEDYDYSFFRIERNYFDHCVRAKSSSKNDDDTIYEAPANCKIFWANNIYINTNITDYHKGGEIYHVHETYYFDNDHLGHADSIRNFDVFCVTGGQLKIRNCLVFSIADSHWTEYYISSSGSYENWELINPDYCAYIIKDQGLHWLRFNDSIVPDSSEDRVDDWDEWQTTWAMDAHSINETYSSDYEYFVDINNFDFRLADDNPAANVGCNDFLNPDDEQMKVDRDFGGNMRENSPTMGAFDVYQ